MNPRTIYLAFLIFPILGAFGDDTAIQLSDAQFDPDFEGAIRSNHLLVTTGGAAIVLHEGSRYFISVGVTASLPDSPGENMRRITVGKAKSLRGIAEFVDTTAVTSESNLSTRTVVTTSSNGKIASSSKILDEHIKTRIATLVKSPNFVGTWKNEDKSLFFFAVGTILPDTEETEE